MASGRKLITLRAAVKKKHEQIQKAQARALLKPLPPREREALEGWQQQLDKKEEELRTRRDSARESLDREVFAVFSDKNLALENQRLKSDLDNVSRERRHLSERICRWEEELSREDIELLGEEGLRQELRVAIKTLQLRDHK